MKQGKIMTLILSAIPKPELIKNLSIPEGKEVVVFSYEGTRFEVDSSLNVQECELEIKKSSTASKFFQQLLILKNNEKESKVITRKAPNARTNRG